MAAAPAVPAVPAAQAAPAAGATVAADRCGSRWSPAGAAGLTLKGERG